MILSHEYQFLFLRTEKTASTSIEISLSRYLGPLDVATTLAPEDEITRMQLGRTAQNHVLPRRLRPPESDSTEEQLQFLERNEFCVAMTGLFYNHVAARDVRAMMGERTWQRVFKFSVERDPYEHAVSRYFYDGGPDRFGTFDRFVHNRTLRPNASIYCIGREVVVDWIIRYEDLATALPVILARVGLEFDGWLPRAKSQFRVDRTPAREFLSAADRRLVEELLALDFEVYESIPSRWPL